MNKYTPEQFEQLLRTPVAVEQPNATWKQALILKLANTIMLNKPKRKFTWPVFGGLGLASIAAALFVIFAQPRSVPYLGDTAAGPYYIASPWVREHVSYHFKDGVIVPTKLPRYEVQYIAFDRPTLDVLVAQLNPVLLNQVTHNGDSLEYAGGDQTFFVQQQNDGSVNFEYHPGKQSSMNDADYVEKAKVRLSHEDQMATVQTWLDRFPQLTAGYQIELTNKEHGPSVETLYLSTLDGGYRFEAANFQFFNGEIENIYGWLVTGIQQSSETIQYGTNVEIETYLNTNPSFPYYASDFPEVDVRYEITGYYQSVRGLELEYKMIDAEQTRQALNIDHPGFVGPGSAYGTMTVGTKEEQETMQAEVENYLKEHSAD